MPMQQAIALLPSSGRISSRIWPPCAKRMNLDTSASSELMPWPVGEATHMQPAASMQHPSGLTPGSEAHTRWSLSRPVLTSMSNAVNWLLEVSPTISVWPSGVITKPFGEPLTAAGDVRQHDHDQDRDQGQDQGHDDTEEEGRTARSRPRRSPPPRRRLQRVASPR